MYPVANYPNIRRTYRHGDKTYYSPRHLGVDLIVPTGTPVYAPFDGRAWKDDDDPADDLGNCVYFEWDRKVMRAAHLSRWGKLGQVRQGDVIGYSGNTGKSTAPHIHLDLYDLSRGGFNVNLFANFLNPDTFNWQPQQGADMAKADRIDARMDALRYTWKAINNGQEPDLNSIRNEATQIEDGKLSQEALINRWTWETRLNRARSFVRSWYRTWWNGLEGREPESDAAIDHWARAIVDRGEGGYEWFTREVKQYAGNEGIGKLGSDANSKARINELMEKISKAQQALR